MEKLTQFSFGGSVWRTPKPIILTFLLFYSLMGYSQQNGAIACNDLVQVSLDGDCEAEITPDMILEGYVQPTLECIYCQDIQRYRYHCNPSGFSHGNRDQHYQRQTAAGVTLLWKINFHLL
jgi:hypothetical protein